MWGEEPEPNERPLARLSSDEAAVYDDLRLDRLGPRVRLEQERIAFGHLERAISTLLARD